MSDMVVYSSVSVKRIDFGPAGRTSEFEYLGGEVLETFKDLSTPSRLSPIQEVVKALVKARKKSKEAPEV